MSTATELARRLIAGPEWDIPSLIRLRRPVLYERFLRLVGDTDDMRQVAVIAALECVRAFAVGWADDFTRFRSYATTAAVNRVAAAVNEATRMKRGGQVFTSHFSALAGGSATGRFDVGDGGAESPTDRAAVADLWRAIDGADLSDRRREAFERYADRDGRGGTMAERCEDDGVNEHCQRAIVAEARLILRKRFAHLNPSL